MKLGRMVIRRAQGSIFGAALALTVCAIPSRADLPDVVEKAPANAQAIMAIHSLDSLTQHWNEFAAAIGADQMPMPRPQDLLVEMGFDPSTLNMQESFGLVVVKDRWEAEFPPVMLLLPVNDYDTFLQALGATVEENIASFTAEKSGDTVYSIESDDYAVLSLDRELVATYEAGDEDDRFEDLIGDVGETITGRNGVMLFIDPDGLAEKIGPMMRDMMGEQLEMMAAMGGQDVNAARQQLAFSQSMTEAALRSAQGVALRFGVDKDGVGFDLGVNWKDDSQMATWFEGDDDARDLLSNFEEKPYIFALSADFRGVNVEQMLDSVEASVDEIMAAHEADDMEEADTQEADDLQESFEKSLSLWKKADGVGMVIYPSPAGFVAILSSSVFLYTGDTDELREAWQTMVSDLNGKTMQQIDYTTEYTADAVEIDGLKADQYQIRMQAGPDNPQIQQMVGMLYGPAGMRGYIVPTDEGLIQTLAPNKAIVRNTIAAMNGENNLAGDSMIKAVSELLPDAAAVRLFINIAGLTDTIGPFIQMQNPNAQLDSLSTAPPMGMGLAFSDGGMFGSFVVPSPLIKAGVEVGTSMMMGPQNAEEEEPLF